jgi:septin family protein
MDSGSDDTTKTNPRFQKLGIEDEARPTIATSMHSLLKGDEVCIRALPRNLERTTVKRGFAFNILVAGRYDLGQEELIETIFGIELDKKTPDELSSYNLQRHTTEVTDGPVKLNLEIMSTPNFGTKINDTNSYKPVLREVQKRMHKHLHNESQLYRKQDTPDERFHVCLYLLAPAGPSQGIHPNDDILIRKLTEYCNVIPVIARADMLTKFETETRKNQIRKALETLPIYQMPKGDEDRDEIEWINHLDKIRSRQPFACMNRKYEVDPWFKNYDPLVDCYSDTKVLQAALIAHMCDLVDSTHYEHYEAFRAEELQKETSASPRFDGNMSETDMVRFKMHEIRENRAVGIDV